MPCAKRARRKPHQTSRAKRWYAASPVSPHRPRCPAARNSPRRSLGSMSSRSVRRSMGQRYHRMLRFRRTSASGGSRPCSRPSAMGFMAPPIVPGRWPRLGLGPPSRLRGPTEPLDKSPVLPGIEARLGRRIVPRFSNPVRLGQIDERVNAAEVSAVLSSASTRVSGSIPLPRTRATTPLVSDSGRRAGFGAGFGAAPWSRQRAARRGPCGGSATGRRRSTTSWTRRRPTSPPRVRMDSGWNCTAAIGRVRCSIAMTTPSSVSAVISRHSGSASRSP